MNFIHGNRIWKSPKDTGGLSPLIAGDSLWHKNCLARRSPDSCIKQVPIMFMKFEESPANRPHRQLF